LHALGTLRSRRTLRSWITFWTRISAAGCKRKRNPYHQQRKNLHAKSPIICTAATVSDNPTGIDR
jgi:hypothetical protein